MRLSLKIGFLASLSLATSGHAQTTQRVDPNTGNYVPVPDPFMRDDPDNKSPNPNRLGNRQSLRNTQRATPLQTAPFPDASLTPAQQLARGAAKNDVAQPMRLKQPDGSDVQMDANGFASMGGMAMYSAPGQAQPGDPLGKPDWWPK